MLRHSDQNNMTIALKVKLVRDFYATTGNILFDNLTHIEQYHNDKFINEVSLITLCKNRFLNTVVNASDLYNGVRFYLDYETRSVQAYDHHYRNYRGSMKGREIYTAFYIVLDFQNKRDERLFKINGSINKLKRMIVQRGNEIKGYAEVESVSVV